MPTDARVLHDAGRPLPRDPAGDDPLVRRLADASTVLIGEASHGTHEFHDLRANLTRRLIEDHGFHAVAIEGDWPDAWQVHQFATGRSDAVDARAALAGFTRFPLWMWRNPVVESFAAWLRERNAAVPVGVPPTAFVGLDLYSLHRSMGEVLAFLDRTDPDAAARARARYAQLVVGAEEYYRTMFRGGIHSWNLRDQHMEATLQEVRDHLGRQVDTPKVVVWAHNSHVGDAGATERGRRGEHTLGQLVRQRHPGDVVSVGMTTFRGDVTAAHDWDGPHHRMRVLDAVPGSHEELLHGVGLDRFWLDMSDPEVRETLSEPRLQRAIGVVYRPETERVSHSIAARLPDQFDVVCHVDETTALRPLDHVSTWDEAAVPATYPSAV